MYVIEAFEIANFVTVCWINIRLFDKKCVVSGIFKWLNLRINVRVNLL